MSNSIPLDPSALQDQSKQLRRISSKASNVASAVSVVATPHYEVSTRSVDDDLDQPVVVENVIPSSFKHTSADNDNHQGKYISMVTDPTISRLIDDNNSSNVNMIETKQSLSNIFSEIDVLTSPISVAIEPTNTSSDLIVSTTTASQLIKPTIGTIANEQVVSKEEQDKSALAARLKAKLEEKAYMIPSFSNLLIDPYNPSTDPYNNSSAGTEQVNTGSTTNTSINSRINPVPTSEPIKVSSASTPLELGDLSPTNTRSRSSTPDKMSARKSSKKSKKNSITSSNVSDDGMGDNTGISASATNDTKKISRNNSSNSIASSTASTPNRKSSVSKRGGENDRDVSSSSTIQVTALDSPGVRGVVAKRASMAGPKVRNIKDLKIKVRPTEPLRSGYLHKLDMNLLPIDGAEHEDEEEEEAWTTQYVTMDVPTGQLEYFTEINR